MYSTVQEVDAYALANSEIDFLDCDSLGITCQLNGALSDSATTVTVDAVTAGEEIKKHDLLQCGDEYMRVTAVTNATQVVVERGWGGTTAAAHADDAVCYLKSQLKAQLISRVSRQIVDLHKVRMAPGSDLWLQENEEMREQAAIQIIYASQFIEEAKIAARIATITNSDFNDGVLAVKYPAGRKFAPGVAEAITEIARSMGVKVGGILRG